MGTSRRNLLQGALAAGAAGALAGCAEITRQIAPSRAPVRDERSPEARLADRIGFGPAEGDLERIRTLGQAGYVAWALRADGDESRRLLYLIRRLDAPYYEAYDLRDLPADEVLGQLSQGAILRAVYGANPLHERMCDFWSNHFNVFGRKGYAAYQLGRDAQVVVREKGLGRFQDLLTASARSPAMLAYLDNPENVRGVPNENYAREIMELHTLGVDGGYSQRDVMEVARCLTGWGLENRFLQRKGSFRFDPDQHDPGEKTVLGHRIPAGGGEEDGRRVIEILSHHPSTARHVTRKLCRHFLGDPDAKVRSQAERAYLASKGDIRATLEPILLSREILDGPPILRRPFDYLVGLIRRTGAQTDGGPDLQGHLAAMGQPLYQWPMPDGYPEEPEAWTGTLLARWNFALALAEDRIAGTKLPTPADPLGLIAPEAQYR